MAAKSSRDLSRASIYWFNYILLDIREKGSIKREEYIEINKVSHTTALKELKDLTN